jgi:hypothetical protein
MPPFSGTRMHMSIDMGAVVIENDGKVTIKDGVSLNEASRAFWDGVQKMGLGLRPSTNLVEGLKELAGCFDNGCSVHMGEDDITVEGYDYFPGNPGNESSYVVRVYSANYEEVMGEQHEGWKDTLTLLIEQIKKESSDGEDGTRRVSGGV